MQRKRMSRWGKGAGFLAALAVMGVSGSAFAQAGEYDARVFRPAVGPHSIFMTEGADTLEHLQVTGGLLVDYASRPLVLKLGDKEKAVVDQQLAAHVLLGFGLFDRLQLDVALPVYLVNDGNYEGREIRGATVGDLNIRGKFGLLSSLKAPVGLGLGVEVGLPTGDGDAFVGAGSVTVTPRLFVDTRFGTPIGDTTLTANVGARWLDERTVHDAKLSTQLVYGAGVEVEVIDEVLALGAEVFGGSQFDDFFQRAPSSPLELLLGAKISTDDGFTITAGAGGGLIGGYGTPDFRAIVGLMYTSPIDHGEVVEEPEPLCPDVPEDYEGALDEDGCPVEEEVVEEEPGCEVPEGYVGLVDEDGCPLLDSDGDGIADIHDQCPQEAEDMDGFEDEDGCPDLDNDNDGIPDAEDECPDQPGLATHNGCPAPEQKVVREKAEIRIMDKVFFETGKAVIQPESFELLDQVGLVLRTNPDITKVEIAGHTDHTGSAALNRALSQERAEAVMNYLVNERGIAAERLTARGYGPDEPIDDSKTKEAMAKNRRVEFRILEQNTQEEDSGVESETESGSEEVPSN